MSQIVGVIPARMASTRFPGKPIATLSGRPMIEHVWRRARFSQSLGEVVIATCDADIAAVAKKFGAKSVMTSKKHERATDRVAEAASKLKAEIYVMIQGDEPLIVPEMIDLVLKPLEKDRDIQCVNLITPLRSESELDDPNTIKVVVSQEGRILFFSRSPIPTRRYLPFGQIPAYKQVCVFAFRRQMLAKFADLKPTPLEIAESIDMLRFLEHGYPVHFEISDFRTHSVDTREDLDKVEAIIKEDPVTAYYEKA